MRQFLLEYRQFIMILVIFAGTVLYLYRYQRKQAFDRKTAWLLGKADYDTYRAHLFCDTGRRIYHDYELKQKELIGALKWDKRREAADLIRQLSVMPMREKDFLEFNNQALNFAVQEKDASLAEQVCEALQRNKRHARAAAEARLVTDIYILNRTDHIAELQEAAKKTKSASEKATAYYRIAKQYHHLGRNADCQKYLEMAYAVFPEKAWQELILQTMENDFALLD